MRHGSILNCDKDAFDFSVNLNIKAMWRVTRAFLPAMLDAGGGSTVNTSSAVSSIIAAPNRFVYGATRAAVIGMTKAIAADFVTQGIRCNAVLPGLRGKPVFAGADAGHGGFRDQPRRLYRPPADEAQFVTGQAISIDGGWANT